jgi:DNA-binding GntR family transcriptional regulator
MAHREIFEKSHSRVPLVRKRRDLFLPPIALDRASSSPLHVQVVRQIAGSLGHGVPPGARLPSSRVLARLLGVSRNTVMSAYDDLVARGLLQGRRGAGMVVAAGPPRVVGAVAAFDPRQVLREAQYPARTLHVDDPDGSDVYLSFR